MTAAPGPGAVACRSLVDLFTLIDELGPEATGEVVVQAPGNVHGSVFMERGRVCWAAARGLARRLTDLLVERSSLTPETMESILLACRAQNAPLGEHLVSRGVLRAADLREALLQHTVESLRRVCRTPARATWSPRSDRGYSPKFTFTTAELCTRVGTIAHRAEAERLTLLLQDLFSDEDWAAAFVRPESSAVPLPVALFGAVPPKASNLVRLGQWAASATDAAGLFSGSEPVVWTRSRGALHARSRIALTHGGAVVVGETGEYGPARILNRRASNRRMEV